MMDLSFWLLKWINFPRTELSDRFQSLLWWICHFDSTFLFLWSCSIWCFNPCYDGFVILTKCSYRHKSESLLWWICHFDLEYKKGSSLVYFGFNPCYDGFVILTNLHLSGFRNSISQLSSFNPCYDGFVILTFLKTRQS